MGCVYPSRKGLANITVISNLRSTQNTMHGTVIEQDREWSMAITELSRNVLSLKLELIITWAILENIFVCIQHPYLPPTSLSPVTDTLMSTVSCCNLKILGRKNLLQAVTLTVTAGQKHISSLVL